MSVTFVVVSVVLLCFRPIFPFSSFQPFLFIGGFDSSALCRSRRELSNAYLLAKIGVDTAENEPLEVWGENSIQYSFASLDEVLDVGSGLGIDSFIAATAVGPTGSVVGLDIAKKEVE